MHPHRKLNTLSFWFFPTSISEKLNFEFSELMLACLLAQVLFEALTCSCDFQLTERSTHLSHSDFTPGVRDLTMKPPIQTTTPWEAEVLFSQVGTTVAHV